jgi:glycosyltransferase involved in cell wall biosynthesis
MRIAQVAPLYESVPPRLYGGTERVVSYLTEALVQLGHEVTLFASGDSVTGAELVACCPEALRLDPNSVDPLAHHVVQLERVLAHADQFDLIHWHVDYLHYPFSIRQQYAHVTTLHGRLDLPELAMIYQQYSGVPVVSISDAQRVPIPWANWVGTVYHGLPESLYAFRPSPGKYLAFLGRISPEKRVDRAIRIAAATGIPLKVAAKVDAVDREYFATIEPLFDHPLVDFIGEIGESGKSDFLGGALGLLFPIDWPEPFGLAVIESLACGTPVVAYDGGSLPELLGSGEGGFIVREFDEAVQAVRSLAAIDRRRCRRLFLERFTARRMATDYVRLYQRLIEENSTHVARSADRVPRIDHRGERRVLHPRKIDAAG